MKDAATTIEQLLSSFKAVAVAQQGQASLSQSTSAHGETDSSARHTRPYAEALSRC
jgi:hypothetical protein